MLCLYICRSQLLCLVSYQSPIMLHIRQKRASKGVTFVKPQTQASSSKLASSSAVARPSKSGPQSARARHVRNASTATSTRASQRHSIAPTKVSNHQRRLASIFMALMPSSPLPTETDAETLEAAQKASIASRAQSTTQQTPSQHRMRTGRQGGSIK
ncbi:uncharacterized protein M421DRAFT_332186 [Didymella exigua CBS 183.55]|uniref:Uncharacterized protein n=1 Tax=Didymella exigua CBS 183.55 TaxID=1150837 RepID=A0A6A5R7J3_9PLEO|nr:uncharacterized protein M421DRAFT_332186 [Didymella exigua CBS 183.55]KAF1923170.1 hypothetical protein M421DRAFT_332186 [Didymella exigua CBS 183.55]